MEAFDKKPKGVTAPLFKPPGSSAPKFAGAIERGSKEAYSIEMRSRYGDFAKQNDIPNKQLAEAQRANLRLDGTKSEIEKLRESWQAV